MNFLSAINATASALHAEQTRMEIVSQNIANANTTRDVNGLPYQRKIVSFETVLTGGPGAAQSVNGVKINQVTADPSPGELVYNPSHPDADKEGFVQMPNVNVATEMVDLMAASRAYEANLAVVKNSKQMATRALTIGR